MGALTAIATRPATAADVAPLHALVERAYRGAAARQGWANEADIIGGPRTTRRQLAAAIAAPGHLILLAEEDDRLIGCVELVDRGGGLAYLGLLTVAPEAQASGLGRRLLAAAETAAAERFAARRIEMTVVDERATLIGWYVRRGYRITGERRPFPSDVEGVIFLRGAPPEMTVLEKAL